MIDRRTIVEKSVDIYLRGQLFGARNYPADKVEILDTYPDSARMARPIDKTYVAVGWTHDDGGQQAELGTAYKKRLYTIDFYVFGKTRVWGTNVSSVVAFCLESDQVIPIVDLADGTTVIDKVDVDYVSVQPVISRTPRPWEEHVFVTRLRVEDYYDSSGGN